MGKGQAGVCSLPVAHTAPAVGQDGSILPSPSISLNPSISIPASALSPDPSGKGRPRSTGTSQPFLVPTPSWASGYEVSPQAHRAVPKAPSTQPCGSARPPRIPPHPMAPLLMQLFFIPLRKRLIIAAVSINPHNLLCSLPPLPFLSLPFSPH